MSDAPTDAHPPARPEPPVLRIEGLAVSFPRPSGGRSRVVDGVSLAVHRAQTVALVGESGSGKTITALAAIGLLPAGARIDAGRMTLRRGDESVDLGALSGRRARAVRGRRIAMIFQEPMTSLNPVLTVGEQIGEAIRLHRGLRGRAVREAAAESLREVGVADAGARLDDYPHQFSGGMRQRVMIAMALACDAEVLLADEPTTALDVTIQQQILDLLAELQTRRGVAIVLITHALGVVAQTADVVCVMYAGRVVECANVFELFDAPLHPYTRALLAAAPRLTSRVERLRSVADEVGSVRAPEPVSIRPAGVEAVPWWPGVVGVGSRAAGPHPTPADASELVEARSGHWLAVRGSGAGARPPRAAPVIGFRRASDATPRPPAPHAMADEIPHR